MVSPFSTSSFSSSRLACCSHFFSPSFALSSCPSFWYWCIWHLWDWHFCCIQRNSWHSSEGAWQLMILCCNSQSYVILLLPQIRRSGNLKHADACTMKWAFYSYTSRIMIQIIQCTNSEESKSQLSRNYSSFFQKILTDCSCKLALKLEKSVIAYTETQVMQLSDKLFLILSQCEFLFQCTAAMVVPYPWNDET